MIDKNCQMATVSGTINPQNFTSPLGAHLVKPNGLRLARARKKRRGLSLMTTLFVFAVLNFQTRFLVVNAAFTCDIGYTTQMTNTQSVCKICAAGSACPTSTSTTTSPCTLGTNYSNQGQQTCTTIPAGFYDAAANTLPKACTTGQIPNTPLSTPPCTTLGGLDYAVNPSVAKATCNNNSQVVYSTVLGRAFCTPCPAGSSCSGGIISACGVGRTAVFITSAGVCSNPASVAGTAVYSAAFAAVTCPAGTYSTSSATTCAPCAAGSYCNTLASVQTTCGSGTKAAAGQTSPCATLPTSYYPKTAATTSLDFGLCSKGKYYSSGTSCTACTINMQCKGGASPTACPTTEVADSTGNFAVGAFYSAAGDGTCKHVPYGFTNSGGTVTACAVGTSFVAKTATCVACTTGLCSSVMPSVTSMSCQLTQYLKNPGLATQVCTTCDSAGKICPDPTAVFANQKINLTGAVTKYSPSGQGQAEGVPYAACWTYGTDGEDGTKAACAAGEYALKGRAAKACTTLPGKQFQIACDIAQTNSCPSDTFSKSPYYYCQPSALDKEATGSNTAGSEMSCVSPTSYAWYGESCTACTTPADGTNDAMFEIGNKCNALYELNAIPCKPGSASLLGLCDGTENTNLADGIEIAFGVPRSCINIKIGATTITTGSIQRGVLPGISSALPQYQCQDCPELQACNVGSTSVQNVYCWGQALPISCYNGIGFQDPGTNLKPCPKNLHLDDRRLQRNDGLFCQDANARYHQNRIITFAAHYFLDHNDDTKEYLDCPFQTETRTVSRHIFWEDDCTTPPCWSISGRNQLGVDGEKSRPKGSSGGAAGTTFIRSDKTTENPKRNRKGFYMTDIDTSGDYTSKVWFMDDDIYEYPYCKVDKNYFNYSVLDGHKKTSWEFSTYKFLATTQQVPYTCPIYKYLNPNYPICTPNYPGFISKTSSNTQTDTAIGQAQVANPTQYLSYLENKGTYTGITMSDCPQFQWMIPGYEGGVSGEFACRIGEMAQCLSSLADYCHTGQDFYCPEGMKPKAGNTHKTINDCEACSAGAFCSTGSSSTCPAGYNCPAYTVNPNMLPSQPGQITAPTPNTATQFSACDFGYCPGKTADGAKSYCPAGFFNNFPSFTTGQFSAANCSPNPPGQKTLAASSTVTSTTVNYTSCAAGTYCPEGSNTEILCPPGSFSASSKGNLNDCGSCTAGKFCGIGSSAVGNCPAGHYCPLQTFFQYEYTCPIGKTVAAGANQSTEANCSTSCAAGQYCREGADGPDATLCDAAFYVCPAASPRTTCAAGSFTKSGSTAATSAGCTPCAIGSFCVGNGPTDLCEMGYIATAASSSTCALTTGGKYTDARGSTVAKVATVGNWSLVTGDTQQTKCAYGQFCNGAGVMIDCPAAKYCPLGTATQISVSAGSVQLETKLWFDKPCRSGYFCAAATADTLVTRGYYTKQGAAADATTLCTAGFNCVKGSIGSKMYACDINTWFTAASDCTTDTQCCTAALCTAGSYCIQGFKNTCPLGFYCPNPRGTNMFEVCPKGTYLKTLGGTLSTSCTKCDAGYGCVEPGASDKYKKCGAGYYCFLGSPTTTPLIYCSTVLAGVTTPTYDSATSTCTNGVDASVTTTLYGVCPVGYFCPLGTLTPQVCPIGTFSGAYAARAATDCIDCTEGYYCSGATAKTECQAGTYCPLKSGAETAIIASGMWSEARYPAAIKCFPGTYLAAADTPKSTCKTTDPGSYQQLFGQPIQNACLNGHDCNAAGIIYPRMCLYGQYAGTPNGACTACQQHSYCAKDAQTTAELTTYKCPSGYVCESGADNQYMNIDKFAVTGAQAYFQSLTATNYLCPRGYFCDATTNPAIGVNVFAMCAAGTYMPAIGAIAQASCYDCPFGYVCDFSLFATSYITPQACPAGQFCVQKTGGAILAADCIAGQFCSAKAGAAYKCPWGTYQDQTKQLSCIQCPNGKMCSNQSLQAVEACTTNHYCQQDTGIGASISLLCLEGKLVLASVTNPNSITLCTDIDKNHWFRSSGLDQSGVALNGLITDGYLWGKTGAKDKIPATATVCQSGFFCVAGDAFPCTNGKWCNSRLRTVDGDVCPAGYYCMQKTNPDTSILTGTTYKNLMTQFCQPGSACPQGTLDTVGQKCAIGTYSSAYGLIATSECHDCPEGFICNSQGMTWATVNTAPQKCPAGKYCLSKTDGTTIVPLDCTIGTYCAGGNIEMIVCEGGSFTDATLQTVCKPCVAGNYCPFTEGVITTPASQSTTCDIGYKCSTGSLHQPEPCIPGTYQNVAGQSGCLGCPIQFYCPYQSMSVPIACPDTMRCPANSIQPIQCQDGENCDINDTLTQSGTIGMTDPRDPTGLKIAYSSCPTGYFCKMGRKILCYAGYVCTINSITPTPTNGQGGYICPKGYWCAAGTQHKAETACAVNFFQPSFGAEAITDCQACSVGFTCSTPGSTFQTPTACPSGKICNSDGTQTDCLPGFYCPTGAVAMIPCEDGTYQDQSTKTSCNKCPSGKYCSKIIAGGVVTSGATIGIDCPIGYYCPDGTPFSNSFPCLPGTFADGVGYQVASQVLDAGGAILYKGCKPCPSTNYCPIIGMTSTTDWTTLYKCKDGYKCNGGNSKEIGDDLCQYDNYCNKGVPTPCPAGSFVQVKGTTSINECIQCPPGKICPTLSVSIQDCPEGYYCDVGNYSSLDPTVSGIKKCDIGYYCPKGSVMQMKCPPGTYQNLIQQKECITCPLGQYCPDSGMSVTKPCDAANGFLNWYCPPGSIYPRVCGIGQTFDSTNNICIPCPAGKFCWPEPATFSADMGIRGACDFANGYVCRSGSYAKKPQQKNLNLILAGSSLFQTYNGPIIRGYQVDAVGIATPCPAGTYQPSAFSTGCIKCMKGRYCDKPGLYSLVDNLCKGGYECDYSQIRPDPPTMKCPAGYQCPSKVPTRLVCEDGFYSDVAGLVVCQPCPAGKYCQNDNINVLATIKTCNTNSVCNGGVSRQPNCPEGLLLQGSSCNNCTAGNYCRSGMVSGPCAAGYICNGTVNSDPNPSGFECPKGSYCGMGVTSGLKCPYKTMSIADKQRQITDCRGCQPGYVCEWGVRDYYPCPTGYYCPPVGDMTAYTQYKYACPAGSYNPQTLRVYLDDCEPCDQGRYCANEAMSNFGPLCPMGHFCPLGTIVPKECRPGTYIDYEGAGFENDCLECPIGSYCPAGSTQPVTCEPGYQCPGNTALMVLCPGGYFCNADTLFLPEICQPNYYCPMGSGQMLPCQSQYVCDWGTEMQVLCGPGYHVIDYGIPGTPNQCQACPKGFFSNLDIPGCRPCTPGYVCYGKTNTPFPSIFNQHNGVYCPRGYFCPLGTYDPFPCPPGTYNPDENAESELKCRVCAPNTFNDLYGAEGCKPCGQFAKSKEEAATCSCIGNGRLYSLADASCRCQSGYEFKDSNGISQATKSLIQDCYPIVFDRCTNFGNGTDFVRTPDGTCKRYDDCANSCGGEPGIRSSVTGICTCNNEQSVDVTCNQDCRNSAAVIEFLNSYQILVTYADGTSEKVSLTDVGDSYGKVVCNPGQDCTAVSVEIGQNGFGGTYNPPQLIDNQISKQKTRRMRLLNSQKLGGRSDFMVSTNSTYTNTLNTINVKRNQSSESFEKNSSSGLFELDDVVEYENRRLQQTSQNIVSNPTYCLKQNQTMLFSIPTPYHYPIYMRDSVLNSNPAFDYGQFLQLEKNMKRKQATGDMSSSFFSFTFKDRGNYVFQDASDLNSLLVVSVKGRGETCPDPSRYVQSSSSTNIAELGVKIKDKIIQKPNYLLYGFLITILVICTAIALVMIGYCLRKNWTIEDMAVSSYREQQYQLEINHDNNEFYQDQNDFIHSKCDLIIDEEDDLDNFNLEIQQDLMDSGKKYLKLFTKKKNKIKKFKVSRRDRLNELIRVINQDLQQLQDTVEDKRLRFLDMDKLHLLDENQMKEQIEQELEAQKERERQEDEMYNKKKDEMLADASKRDLSKYQNLITGMKVDLNRANKELNNVIGMDDLTEEELLKRKEMAIHDNGDLNSRANKLVWEIENNPNLNAQEKESLMQAHEEAMLELKIQMDNDRKKQEKELDRALQDKLARRKRLREEQYKKQIKEETKLAEKDVEKVILMQKEEKYEAIKQQLDRDMETVDYLPTVEQKKRTSELEEEAKAQRDKVDSDLIEQRKNLIEQRKKEIAQKFLSGAENDDDLRKEIQDLLSQHGSGQLGAQILAQAEDQKKSEEEKLKERLANRKAMKEREREKQSLKIEKDLEEQDIMDVTELEKVKDEAFFKQKLKEALAKRFSRSPTNSKSVNIESGISQSVDLSSLDKTDAQKASMISDEKKIDEQLKAEEQRKQEAKQRIFDITQNLDTAIEQKSLLAQLQNTDQALAQQLAEQDAVTEAKLAKRRELLKARRRNKQNGELEEARLKDKIELIEYEQAEKKKMSEDYIKSLFKRGANDPIETQESKAKRMELLNEFLSDQFLDRLSGLLMKQFLEKDQTLKNLMQKYMDQRVAEISAIQANFKIDMEALDRVQGYDPIKLAKVKKTLEFNEQSLIREVDLRLQNAQKEEESALCKEIENRHSQEQIKMRERIADEHANLRIQLLGESELLDKEDLQEKQALQKYEDLKKKENQRRIEKIEMEKKKVNAEFDSELNEKFKDYEDMMKKRAEKKDELQNEAVSIRNRINQNKEALRKKAELFKGVDQREILKNVQQNAESIEQVILQEKLEQYLKLKQKMDLRKKQVKRVKQAKEEAEKTALTNEVGGSLGKLLKRRGTIILDSMNEDDSELLKKLKAWKQRKKEYIRQKAQDLTVDMEKEQIRTMIVKLRQIEFQLKELNHEKKRKKIRDMDIIRQNTAFSNSNKQTTGNHRLSSAMKGSGLGVSREHQVSQQSGFLVRQGSANSLAGLSKVRGTGSSFRAPTMKAALHQRTSTDEFGY